MDKKNFIEKYRKRFGCKNIGEVCWCEVCTGLEKAWNDICNYIIDSIKTITGLEK